MASCLLRYRVLGLLLFTAACGAPKAPTLELGALLSFTGDLSQPTSEVVEAIGLAVDEINAGGGILGGQVELKLRNDFSQAERSAEVAEDMSKLNLPVIIGATGSDATERASAVLNVPKKITLVSGSASASRLTDITDDGYLFRTCPSDAQQAQRLGVRAINQNKHRSFVVLHENRSTGRDLGTAIADTIAVFGGQAQLLEYEAGATRFDDDLDKIFASGNPPQAVVLVGNAVDGAEVIRTYVLRYTGQSTFWYFTSQLSDPLFASLVGQSNFTFPHEGFALSPPRSRYQLFADKMMKRMGREPQPGTYAANYYDAVYLAALAVEAAGRMENSLIRDHMFRVSGGGFGSGSAGGIGTPFGPGEFAPAVAEIKKLRAAGAEVLINYEGASGNVDFTDEFGDVIALYDIWQIDRMTGYRIIDRGDLGTQ